MLPAVTYAGLVLAKEIDSSEKEGIPCGRKACWSVGCEHSLAGSELRGALGSEAMLGDSFVVSMVRYPWLLEHHF